ILESIAVIEKRDQENPKGESKIPEDRLAPQQARRQQRKDESDQPTSGVQRKGHRWQPAVPIPFALVGGQCSERWQQSNSPGPNQSPPEVGVFFALVATSAQIRYRQHGQELDKNPLVAAEVLRAHAPLRGDPSGHEQRGERRLEPIPQHQPREYRADRPQQDASGPMFLKVEDLSARKMPPPRATVPTACSASPSARRRGMSSP